MQVRIRDFTEADARAIVAWRYEPPHDVYDAGEDPEDRKETLDPTVWPDVWFAADDADSGELVGFDYERAGFVRGEVYVRRFPGGAEVEFLRMERPA